MGAEAHPAYAAEHARLEETTRIILKERALARDEVQIAGGELAEARVYSPDELPIREMLYAKAVDTVRNMNLALKKPYFTRVDFKEDHADKQTYYIGRYGVLCSDTLNVQVVDWRAPLANLYYSGQLGRVEYEAPDGKVEGELTLKRQLSIDDGELISIFDTDIASQDAYLQAALSQMTGDRLREIVTTIQAEQNFVIRHPLKKNLIVQGVAGSGKTTIALHRIAYLLYAFSNQLRAEHMMILAPNPLFLNFIAGVLPDLGVEKVRQTTFAAFMREYLAGAMPKLDMSDRTEKVLSCAIDTRAASARVARFKGSLAISSMLDEFLDEFERDFAPAEGIAFGPVTLFTKAEMDKFLLVDEKPFPMQRRVAEFKKQLTLRAGAAAKRVNQFLMNECDRRAALMRAQIQDAAQLRARLDKLYESRDARIKQTLSEVKPFVQNALNALPSSEPYTLYEAFLRALLSKNAPDTDAYAAAEYTLARMDDKKPLELEDAAPLAWIALRLKELKRMDIRHIVIDEAQDFSPLEVKLLTRALPGATYTIVGDLMQGIRAWRGINDWAELAEGVFGGKCVRHFLVTSYRNTIEIMNAALNVARRRPTPGQAEAKPVVRHGPPPVFERAKDLKAQAALITRTIEAWKSENMQSFAIMHRQPGKLGALIKLLPEALGAKPLNVNDEEFKGGVLLASAASVKGLEFDGVIVLDADDKNFPDTDLDARLLYVCMTRPLHRLMLITQTEFTPLLAS